MKITKLILHEYKRFLLNGVHHLVYTPESPFQLIIGNNGSGKTSLLEELSPLPAESDDYNEGGYKEIHIQHNNRNYILRNTFPVKAGKHDFIMDNVYLNEQGTQSAQRDLVLEHFGYDNEIHNIMMGGTNFTELPPTQRRALFVRLSQSDMTFVMSVYQRLKSKLRDLQGTLKQLNDIITSEQLKLLPEEEVHHAKHQLHHLNQQLKSVYQLIGQDNQQYPSHHDIQQAFHQLETSFYQLDLAPLREKVQLTSIDEANKALIFLESHLAETAEKYQAALEESNKIQSLLQQIEYDSSFNPDEATYLRTQAIHRINQLFTPEEQERIQSFTLQETTSIKLKLMNLAKDTDAQSFFLNFPTNPNKQQYNKENHTALLTQEKTLKLTQAKLTMQNTRIEQVLKQMTEEPAIQCPSCQFNWIPGFDEDKKSHAEQTLTKNLEQLKEIEHELEQCQNNIAASDNWRQMMYEFNVRYYQPTMTLPSLWDNALDEDGWMYNNPAEFLTQLNSLLTYWTKAEDVVIELEKVKQIELQLSQYEYQTTGDGKYLLSRIRELEAILEALKKRQVTLSVQYKSLSALVTDANRGYSDMENWNQQFQDYQNAIRAGIDGILREVCLEQEHQLQTEISTLAKRLRDQELIVNTIKTNEQHLKQYTDDIVMIKILMAALSPQEGLIAKSLVGFIRVFIQQINAIIGNIWSYDLLLDASDMETITYDYKFPVNIDNTNRAKDIAKTSKGQKEVINFAFKILIMHYLKMNHYPLILDEVGHNFSENHRDKFFNYIEELVETNQTQQIFIVSHIASSHDALTNADIVSIEMENVTLQEKTNRVCQLT